MEIVYDPPGREARETVTAEAVTEAENGIYFGEGRSHEVDNVTGYIPYNRLYFVLPE